MVKQDIPCRLSLVFLHLCFTR